MRSTFDPDKQFLASKKDTYTYEDLGIFISFFSAFLREQELNDKQPIGLLADSCDELVFLIAACWELEIPFVCFNPNAKKQTLKKQIEALNPTVIFSDRHHQKNDYEVSFKNIHSLSLPDILGENIPAHEQLAGMKKHDPEQVFGYFFTSGTTDEPKIVPLKRAQMISASANTATYIQPENNDYWLLCLPLHHIGGISIILRSLSYRSAIYRLDRFDAPSVAQLLTRNKQIIAASLVPTMLKRLLDDSSFTTHNRFGSILLGGGPIPSTLLEKCIERKIPVISSYGMTETCAQITALRLASSKDALNSAGPICEPNLIEIRDANRQKLGPDKSGTIWLKGKQLFDGYYDKSVQDCFDESGWFNTGDFGRLDEKRRLYIESRRSDLIVTGGENVSPFEVEEALKKVEEICDAAVVGLPDKEWGQKIAAVIVFNKNQEVTEDKLRNELKKKLENFKIPKQIIVADVLPRTETGKIKRKALQTFF